MRVTIASQTERDSVNGVNEEKSETVEWVFVTGPTFLVRRNRDMHTKKRDATHLK